MKKSDLIIKDEIILGKKTVVIEISEGINIVNYEREMIDNNPSLSFFNMEIKEVNNIKSLQYSIGSKWSLNDYLKDEKLSISEKIKISEIIFNKFSMMKEYILDNRKLLFNSDKIFLDKSTLSVYMIYLPIEINIDVKIEDELRNLFTELFNDAGRYKSELSIVERKLITGLISRNASLERIEKLFNDYDKLNSSESLEEKLYGFTKGKEDSIKKESSEEELDLVEDKKETIKEKEKRIKKITYASVIDENYDIFEGFDEGDLEDEEDDDYLQYKEFKELQEYDKALNNSRKIRRLLNIQFYIFVALAGIGGVLGADNMKVVVFIIVIIIISAAAFNIALYKNLEQGEEKYEEI